ncbi:MAG: FtsX-like permease family protein [Cryomorphaceae bacterium]|jgi:putative ABC transport system permease protein|nr:FtsX-like permease family protein [Cryomorphaceae bacterium]MBT3502887.1 FtsX-like permease family protein [Cryomorphaceae bacterium]MBT3688862.1 FtsX-like permease family protein [Cryomorphaceae bacterium]MBT4221978.1 FtsX-like permease family protein [Cryomorphaceae bacterium]MBT4293412.1 FtsX-like permease family protein [Cryomorphaceae bacterium]|tara:strand:+ start:767 stop:1999 length:1233 start_codon:yes stop_codon:yes gene_type:complete
MFNIERWKEIFQSIQKNKLRTALSGLTVSLGILIFIILFGLGEGLKNSYSDLFLNNANNVIYIYPGKTTKPFGGFKTNRRIEIKNGDIDALKEEFSSSIEYINPTLRVSEPISFGLESFTFEISAVSPSNQLIEKHVLMKGRYINEKDIKEKNKVVTIGRLVARDIFKGEDPLGKFINLGSRSFKVIGVFQDTSGDTEENKLIIPYTTRQQILKGTDIVGTVGITFDQSWGGSQAVKLSDNIKTFLKKRKSVDPTDPSGIRIRNVADEIDRSLQFANALQIIVTFVGIGTLIAGIIGISNIMVFIVKERTKELGIRKALGAEPNEIIKMILTESIFITAISGFLGMMTGIIALNSLDSTALQEYFITRAGVDLNIAFFATVILIIFGVIAGYIPAKRAAQIKPIVALRDE